MSDADIAEIAEQHGFIFAAIVDTWGERCPDRAENCWCCKAWAEYDAMKRDGREYEDTLVHFDALTIRYDDAMKRIQDMQAELEFLRAELAKE